MDHDSFVNEYHQFDSRVRTPDNATDPHVSPVSKNKKKKGQTKRERLRELAREMSQ